MPVTDLVQRIASGLSEHQVMQRRQHLRQRSKAEDVEQLRRRIRETELELDRMRQTLRDMEGGDR